MALGAHPDDIEILAAGTLAKYREQGHDVAMCVLTDGSLGAETGPAERIARMRRDEAVESAGLIGAALYWIGRPDGLLTDDRETRTALIESLRHFAPDLLLTHGPDDYHPDHRTTGLLTLACRQLTAEPMFHTGSPALAAPPPVLYMDNLALDGGRPDVWVDISATIETKRRMLSCHRSQNEVSDYLAFLEKQGALRGLQCGVAYAEGFRHAHSFPATPSDLV